MDNTETPVAPLSLVPPQAAADRLGLNLRTLQRMVKKGTIPAPVRIRGSNRIGFYDHELQEFLATLPRTREAV